MTDKAEAGLGLDREKSTASTTDAHLESCPVCGAPVVRTKGYDNGLQGAAKIAGHDTLAYAPLPSRHVHGQPGPSLCQAVREGVRCTQLENHGGPHIGTASRTVVTWLEVRP